MVQFGAAPLSAAIGIIPYNPISFSVSFQIQRKSQSAVLGTLNQLLYFGLLWFQEYLTRTLSFGFLSAFEESRRLPFPTGEHCVRDKRIKLFKTLLRKTIFWVPLNFRTLCSS